MDSLTAPDAPSSGFTSERPQGSHPGWWDRLTATRRALVGWTTASLVANILIIVTGAFVRLTGSGLGCPTWPQCDAGSYVPHQALGHHGVIEFANRTLTFVLILLAIMVYVTARRSRADGFTRWLALVVGFGIPFQGVIGGLTVLTHLNPYVVALHLVLSLTLVALLTRLLMHVAGVFVDPVDGPTLLVCRAVFVGMVVACWLGTVVTGSGPHSGGGGVARTGLDIELVARVHAASVWFTVLLTLAALWLLRRRGSSSLRWALLLLGVEVVQGVIGYVQYFTGVPIVPVLFHMLGAGVAVAAASALLFSVRPDAAACPGATPEPVS